jgi:ketosteroid isomerase-like protein
MIIENVQAVSRACAAWETGDVSVIREIYAPDVVAEGGALWPEGSGQVHGAETIIQTFQSLMAAFERSEVIPEYLVDVEDPIIVQMLWRGVVQGSHAPIEQRLIGAFHFRDGRIVFIAWHAALDAALDAAGLPRSAADTLIPFEVVLASSPAPRRREQRGAP